jgi:hypothetical protein
MCVLVIFISFQFLGNIESFDHQNTYARFIFSQDCLAPLWKVIAKPPYADNEVLPLPPLLDTEFPNGNDAQHYGITIVTPYRLLVSAVTLAFGSAKIVCTYTGRSGAMSTLDWAFSVPVALLCVVQLLCPP